MNIKTLKKLKFVLIALLLYGVTFFLRPEFFFQAVDYLLGFLLEMLQVLPPVFLITAFTAIWVPSETIKKGFGENSGWRGKLTSFLIGSLSAGPIYAAFPAAVVLFQKGAGVGNIVIIISAWAVVKIPMLVTETAFLGISFAATRYLLTVPAILILGWVMDKAVKRSDITSEVLDTENEKAIEGIRKTLPGINCRACGYPSCDAFAAAVIDGDVELSDCKVLAKKPAV